VPSAATLDLFAPVIGQERAVAQLRAAAATPVHAYLLVGPPGSGKRDAALGLAAALLCEEGGCSRCSACRRSLHSSHRDLLVVERVGVSISLKQADEIVQAAALSPAEGGRKVMVLVDFHLVDKAAPALLKTIEEPPPGTVFIILADYVPPELVTIASRCVRIDFALVPEDRLVDALVTSGVDPTVARDAARVSGGRVDRARLLAADPELRARRAAWDGVPGRLDGTGATASMVAADLLALIASAGTEPLLARQVAEIAELEERVAITGERGSGRKDMEERHRRELKRLRTDELRSGLAALEGVYRDRAASAVEASSRGGARAALEAAGVVQGAAQALERNPNEALLLQALMVRLTPR
jgi:DNA polymerase III subunit delta'